MIHHHTAFRADVYLAGSDNLNAWAIAHALIRRVGADDVRLAPIEAAILGKLRYDRLGRSERHLRDIRGMLRIGGEMVDRPELERWAARFGVEDEWQQARTG